MHHIAIDLGSRESQVCVRDSSGNILHEQKLNNSDLLELFDRPKAVVSMETCSEAFAVADRARSRGHEVRVVPSSMVRSLGVGARRTKTTLSFLSKSVMRALRSGTSMTSPRMSALAGRMKPSSVLRCLPSRVNHCSRLFARSVTTSDGSRP